MSFFEELKRRNVFRVAVAYLVAAWLVLQVTETVAPILELPVWISRALLLLIVVGFFLALILAWAYELTPDGVKREKDVDRAESVTARTGRKLDFAIIGVLSVALAFFALDRFVWHEHDAETLIQSAALEKSIAVLPFENRSADESDAYFVDGIHDDILTQLHKLSGIDKVISRTSVERYRDTDLRIPEIAAELGVATILEGGVQRAGDRVRITVQLIGAANDQHLWAENFDRELTTENVFEIQSEISTAIARALQATLTADESSDLATLPTTSLEAYDAYLVGRHVMKSRRLDDLAEAQSHFEDAIDIDPEFALALTSLADAINLQIVFRAFYGEAMSWDSEEVINVIGGAQEAARSALEINPRLGEAYAALGYSSWILDRNEESGGFYERALALSPNYADLYRWRAQQLEDGGRLEAALAIAERSVELDPNFAPNHSILAQIYGQSGRTAAAIGSFERALELTPDSVFVLTQMANSYSDIGEFGRAIAAARRAYVLNPGNGLALALVTLSYYQLGDVDEFRRWAALANQSGGNIWAHYIAWLEFRLAGEPDLALEEVEKLLAIRQEGCEFCVLLIAHDHMLGGRAETLINLIENYFPELLDNDNPSVSTATVQLVAPTYWALRDTGQLTLAEQLFEAGAEVMQSHPRVAFGDYGTGIADVTMHLVRGDRQFSLEALSDAIESGWRDRIALVELAAEFREEPVYQAAMKAIEADFADQLAWLAEQERLGNVPPFPE
jgi:TolB-like protein/Flp pilus assembly protein TadD